MTKRKKPISSNRAKPFDSLSARERKKIARSLRRNRIKSRTGEYITGRGWGQYNIATGDLVKKVLEQKLAQKKGVVDVLDWGAGNGLAMHGVKTKYGDRVRTSTISLTRPKYNGKPTPGIDHVHRGAAENYRFPGKYDLIIDVFGANLYSAKPKMCIEAMVRALKIGGHAIVMPATIKQTEILEELKSQGIIDYTLHAAFDELGNLIYWDSLALVRKLKQF